MLESKFSRTVECDEDQKSLEEPGWKCKNASSNSLAKIWKSLDKERKLKAGENITRPTVLPKGTMASSSQTGLLKNFGSREKEAPQAQSWITGWMMAENKPRILKSLST
jgi:hypothetical protein